jgi:hypothetical protein
MNKPKQRYLLHLTAFDEIVKKTIENHNVNPLSSFGQLLYQNDGRTPFFQLQGLARIDMECGKNEIKALKWKDEFKSIEDAIGIYDFWLTLLKNNQKWNFPKEGSSYIEYRANLSLGVLEERLITKGWITKVDRKYLYEDSSLLNYKKELDKSDWHNPIKEAKKLAKFLRDETIDLHQKIENKELDLDDIELGVHEFRRKLRWLSIYASALVGKIMFSNNDSQDPLNKYITKFNREYKFNILPENDKIESPVSFLRGGFYAMGELIQKIGDYKDRGLYSSEMLHIGELIGMNQKNIITKLGENYSNEEDIIKNAKSVINKYVIKENLLIHIADNFNKQV